ncbi:MAG: family 16 glycoside hydrolase [Parabacteroides merdae]
MEIQILDCEHPIYKDITPLQHHGSVYGIIQLRRNHRVRLNLRVRWNYEEIVANGDNIKVTVNGVGNRGRQYREATKNGTADHKEHPGLFNKKGHIGFLGHGSLSSSVIFALKS